ncbi:MAG: hypothetical protein NXY57DRAFT_535577 [Lentinula lateritia]|nr:MAG: hypothetical protein NXY57DRAFT_535577 [Lentinula lateritia]
MPTECVYLTSFLVLYLSLSPDPFIHRTEMIPLNFVNEKMCIAKSRQEKKNILAPSKNNPKILVSNFAVSFWYAHVQIDKQRTVCAHSAKTPSRSLLASMNRCPSRCVQL